MRTLNGLRVYYDNMGFPDESIAVMRRARMLDPLSNQPKLQSLEDLLAASRYLETIGVARDILARAPNETWPMCALCIAYAGSGQTQKARATEERVRTMNPWPPDFWECEYRLDIATGNRDGARRVLEAWAAAFPDKYPSATDIAKGYVEINDFDKASDWFERAYERHEFLFFFLTYFPDGAKYRATPRWKALTQQPRFRGVAGRA
jgi:tetratricopeptide (TPR) repeat protein